MTTVSPDARSSADEQRAAAAGPRPASSDSANTAFRLSSTSRSAPVSSTALPICAASTEKL